MKLYTKILTVSVLALLTACGGGDSKADRRAGDSLEKSMAKSDAKTTEGKMIDAYLGAMNDMADAIDTIDDEESAKKAAETISKIAADMEEFSSKYEGQINEQKLGMALMLGSNRNEFMKTQMRLSTGMMKLATQNPEVMKMISEEMEKMPQPGG